jgi:hypothetical protein
MASSLIVLCFLQYRRTELRSVARKIATFCGQSVLLYQFLAMGTRSNSMTPMQLLCGSSSQTASAQSRLHGFSATITAVNADRSSSEYL